MSLSLLIIPIAIIGAGLQLKGIISARTGTTICAALCAGCAIFGGRAALFFAADAALLLACLCFYRKPTPSGR